MIIEIFYILYQQNCVERAKVKLNKAGAGQHIKRSNQIWTSRIIDFEKSVSNLKLKGIPETKRLSIIENFLWLI